MTNKTPEQLATDAAQEAVHAAEQAKAEKDAAKAHAKAEKDAAKLAAKELIAQQKEANTIANKEKKTSRSRS